MIVPIMGLLFIVVRVMRFPWQIPREPAAELPFSRRWPPFLMPLMPHSLFFLLVDVLAPCFGAVG